MDKMFIANSTWNEITGCQASNVRTLDVQMKMIWFAGIMVIVRKRMMITMSRITNVTAVIITEDCFASLVQRIRMFRKSMTFSKMIRITLLPTTTRVYTGTMSLKVNPMKTRTMNSNQATNQFASCCICVLEGESDFALVTCFPAAANLLLFCFPL